MKRRGERKDIMEVRGGERYSAEGTWQNGIVIFFFNDTATTEIYTLSLHDALPIFIIPRATLRIFIHQHYFIISLFASVVIN